jgi:hypothetical protein
MPYKKGIGENKHSKYPDGEKGINKLCSFAVDAHITSDTRR